MPLWLITVRALYGHLRRFPVEAGIWAAGLAAMASMDPQAGGSTWCLFANLGFEGCPGCGLGRAIAHLARGAWDASFQAHPFAVPVVLLLCARIDSLLRESYAGSLCSSSRTY